EVEATVEKAFGDTADHLHESVDLALDECLAEHEQALDAFVPRVAEALQALLELAAAAQAGGARGAAPGRRCRRAPTATRRPWRRTPPGWKRPRKRCARPAPRSTPSASSCPSTRSSSCERAMAKRTRRLEQRPDPDQLDMFPGTHPPPLAPQPDPPAPPPVATPPGAPHVPYGTRVDYRYDAAAQL